MIYPVYSTKEEQMSPEYLAGFFDGEGCIDVQRMYNKGRTYAAKVYVRPRVRISQATAGAAVLHALHAEFGGHVSHRKAQTDRQQDTLSLEFLSEDSVRGVLGTMLPHLVVKKEQALLVLWWLDNCKARQSDLLDGIDQARTAFKEELSAMKRDPQRLSERAICRINGILMR